MGDERRVDPVEGGDELLRTVSADERGVYRRVAVRPKIVIDLVAGP
jgi:hypothetical protein